MTNMRVTVRVEIEMADGTTTVVERSKIPTAFGDNPIFFGDVAEQSVRDVGAEVGDAIEGLHGKAPHSARVAL
jgi:hypothetical protein